MAAFLDACRFVPTAGGTTDWTYSSAVTGYQSPAAANVANGRLYKYRAESADLSQWEFGEGAYNTSTGVLARTTVLFNSSGGTSKINFTLTPQVAIIAMKEDLLSVEEANSFTTAQQSQARSNIGVTAIGAATTGQIPGTTSNTQPAAGFVGELVASSNTLTFAGSGTPGNVTSISLTAGVWDIEALGSSGGASGNSTTEVYMAIATSSGVVTGGTLVGVASHWRYGTAVPDLIVSPVITRRRVAITTTTTYYLNAQASFNSAYTITAEIEARRVS